MCEIIILIKRNVQDWQSINKIDSWNTLYLFLYIQLVFYSFKHTKLPITYVFIY